MGKEGFCTLKFKFHQPVVEASSPIGTVTSRFGDFESFRTYPHQGVDYACPVGTEIHAPIDGVVSSIRDYGDTSLGKAVFVKMKDGTQYVIGHLSEIKVKEGEVVKTGDLLALSGNTGHTTGPHLHFGAFDVNGKPIDPGNIPFSAFSPHASNHLDVISIANQDVVHVQHSTTLGTWLADKVSGAAKFILEPVGNALGDGLTALFVGTMHTLPMVLTVGGLICFLLTIALGNHRPYFWGIGMWAGSAIVRGISIEAGI